MKITHKKGFTFIEILVVITIIVLLTSAAAVAYGQFLKSSRDAKRKADLEQLRASMEIYKSTSGSNIYPYTGSVGSANTVIVNPTTLSQLVSGSYISSLPSDPKNGTTCPTYVYAYSSDNKSYTIYAQLENTSSSDATGSKPTPAVTVGSLTGTTSITLSAGCNGLIYNYWINNP